MNLLQTQNTKEPTLFPINCSKHYKSLILAKTNQKPYSTAGTTEEALLKEKLLTELYKTQKLTQISKQIQRHRKRKRRDIQEPYNTSQRKQKKSKKVSLVSAKKVPCKKHKTHSSYSTLSSSSNSTKETSSNTSYSSSQT